MHAKSSITFSILFPVGLAILALLSLQLFFLFPASARPVWVWSIALVCGITAIGSALRQSARLRRRLQELSAFLAHASDPDTHPTLPVRKDDELGAVEYSLHRLVAVRAQQLQQLQDENKELEAILQSMTEGIVVIDLDGNIVRCNRAALHLFGLDPVEDWLGRPFHEFSRHPVLHQLLAEQGLGAESPTSAETISQEIEVEGKETRQLAVSVMRLSQSGTRGALASGYVLDCHDLTPMKRLESIRADFVANVSHELRTPLTAIKGYAETLLNGAAKDPEHSTRFLTIIDRHSERLSRLIDDLLTLSNLELGRTELQREELYVSELVDAAFDVVQEKAQRGTVRLSRHLPPSLPMISGDRDRLHQVLINLIDNAVKYTPAQGQVTVSVQVLPQHAGQDGRGELRELGGTSSSMDQASTETAAEPGRLEIAVSDTGCGIPETDIPRLTQRFYRVDKARSRELGGTGLGLAIVKHIVLAHGGSLQIESQLDQGTTVRVTLPLMSPTPMPHQAHLSHLPNPRQPTHPTPSLSGGTS